MRKIFLFALLLLPLPAHAVTYFIGTDGGNSTQCDGKTNHALAGASGTNCRLSHPFWLLNTSTGNWANFTTGDTVQFNDVGPYYMGQVLGGLGSFWSFCAGNEPNCHLPSFPNNSHFLGVGAGACHDSGHTKVTNATQLIGINDTFFVFSQVGTVGVDVECFDISGAQTCTNQGSGGMTITNTALTSNVATYSWTFNFGAPIAQGEFITVAGTTNGGGAYNFTNKQIVSLTGGGTSSGTFTIAITHANITSASDTGTTSFAGTCGGAGISNNLQNGVLINFGAGSQGPSQTTMADISVHATSHNGFWGSLINSAPTDISNFSDIYFAGNGLSGWDTDSGSCGTSCESQGTLNLTNIHAIWSGCVEVIPNSGTIGGAGYNYCVSQAYNGSGDCLVMIASGGTWNWSHISTMNCIQDGDDFLHLADDPASGVIVNVTGSFNQFINGQTFKLGGKTASATNVVGIGNCNWSLDNSFPLNPSGWNSLVGFGNPGTCRANDGMAFSENDGYVINLGNITNVTDQQTAWDFTPPYSGPDCTTGAHNCVINMTNIVTMGFPSPINGLSPGDIVIGTTFNPFTNGSLSHTVWFGTRAGACPTQPNTTSCNFADPKFTSESAIATTNIIPLAGSPLIGTGTTYSGLPSVDVFGVTYSSPPPIGAAMPSGTVSSPTNLKGVILKGVTIH